MEKEQTLAELVEQLKSALGAQLVSVILYGSGATDDWDRDSSDLNVLCVLQRVSTDELRRAEPAMRWWTGRQHPAPLLLTEEEVRTSTDCFPMEFRDMQEHRRILHGPDVINGLTVDQKFYRAQVEHELRAKQLRLRQRAAEALKDTGRLQRLMTDSISTFCVLGRHALILQGATPHWSKREVVKALEAASGSQLNALSEILAIRAERKQAPRPALAGLLERYLDDVATLVRFVDGLSA